MAKSNSTTKLKKENDQLKIQIQDIAKELSDLKSKVDSSGIMASKENGEVRLEEMDKSLTFLSDEYDDLKDFRKSLEVDFRRITNNVKKVEESVFKLDEAIEAIQKYSYQYNIKILGITQTARTETAQETTELCLKLFSLIGTNVTEQDIDIAHRVPNKRNSNSPPRPPTIICTFTRRLAKESVMRARKEIAKIEWEKADKVKVYDHLTPKTQELFNKSKEFQRDYKFTFCWTRNSTIFLKEAEDSAPIKVTTADVLDNLAKEFNKDLPFGGPVGKDGQVPNGEFVRAPPDWKRIWPPAEEEPGRPRTRQSQNQKDG